MRFTASRAGSALALRTGKCFESGRTTSSTGHPARSRNPMYLSDRDLKWALRHGQLLVVPHESNAIGPTSIDLTLDKVEEAKVWDIPKFKEKNRRDGLTDLPLLNIGKFEYKTFAEEY